MNKKLNLTNIVLSPNGGVLSFSEPSKRVATTPRPGQPGTAAEPTVTVAVRFPTSAEAAKYEQGEEYTITITKTKK